MAIEFQEYIKRTLKLESYLNSKAPDVIEKHQGEIIELSNKQLLQGVNTKGKLMQRGYSTQYGKRRKKAGLQTSFVDLKFTGKYQDTKKGIKVKGGMNIESDADYEKYLRGNFPDHVGLTKQNADVISDKIVDDIVVLIEKYYT